MDSLNLAQKFIAFDDIYDKSGSNFEEIFINTNEMFMKIKDNEFFSEYINDDFFKNYLGNIYNSSFVDKKIVDEKHEIYNLKKIFTSLNFFVIYLRNTGHAFSISFGKNIDSTYDLMFFNSGNGATMHPYDPQKNMYGCCLFKKNISEVDCLKIIEDTEKFFRLSTNYIEKVYDFYVSKIFLPDEIYNIHKNPDDTLKKAEYLKDYLPEKNILYIKTQATGNCTGRALFYPILFYYSKIYKISIEDSLKKLLRLKLLLSYDIYNKIIEELTSININNLYNNEFSKNYLNETIELINILKISNNYYSSKKTEYFDEDNVFLNDIIEKINKLDINNFINYNYLNYDVSPIKKTINIKDLLSKSNLSHEKIVDHINYISKLIIDSDKKYFLLLEALKKVLNLINNEHENRDNIYRIIYYSVILKKALLTCYQKVKHSAYEEKDFSSYYGGLKKPNSSKIVHMTKTTNTKDTEDDEESISAKDTDVDDDDEDTEDDKESISTKDTDNDDDDEDTEDDDIDYDYDDGNSISTEGEEDDSESEKYLHIEEELKLNIPDYVSLKDKTSATLICELLLNIFSQFIQICNIKINNSDTTKDHNDREDNEKQQKNIIDLFTFYNNSLILFLYINFEYFIDLFKDKKYLIKFKKINLDKFDKLIKPRSDYSYENISSSYIDYFMSDNGYKSLPVYINSHINKENITNYSKFNILAIQHLLLTTYFNMSKIIYKKPVVSNYFDFYDYVMKIYETNINYLNLNNFDSYIIDIDTYFSEKKLEIHSIKKNFSNYFTDKKYNDMIIGFNDLYQELYKSKDNILIRAINNILKEIKENNNINKNNVENFIINVLLFYKIYSIEYDISIINEIIANYKINNLLIELLTKKITDIDESIISNLIFNKTYNIEKKENLQYEYYYSDYNNPKIKLESHFNIKKIDYLYKVLINIPKNSEMILFMSTIISDNIEYFDNLIKNIDTFKVNDIYYKNNGKIYYEYENNFLINFNFNNQNIVLIMQTDIKPPYDDSEDLILFYLFKLGEVYSKYKNYDIFSKRIFILSKDFKTFISEDEKYTIKIDDCDVFFNDKKLICNDSIENKDLMKFIYNYLSFENKMYIDIFYKDDEYFINLTRYKLEIKFDKSKFYIKKKEIITDFKDKYYLYRWIYGSKNLLITKYNNKYQILLFNNIYDEDNNGLIYKKDNMFWFDDDFYYYNSPNFEYYFIDISPNLVFLDINTISNKSLYYLCYTYIFFNKTHENIDLLNIINTNLKNNITDDNIVLNHLKYYIMKFKKLNTPFIYLINSYFLTDQEKFYYQKNYFEDVINLKNIFKNNIHNVFIEPINKWKFMSSIGIDEYNKRFDDAIHFIDRTYYAYDNSDYDEIHINVDKETYYEKFDKKLIFEDVVDPVYVSIDPLSYDDSYDTKKKPKKIVHESMDYFILNGYLNKEFYRDYLNKKDHEIHIFNDYEYNKIPDISVLINKNFENEFLTEYSHLINKIKNETLDNIAELNKDVFTKIINKINSLVSEKINIFLSNFGDSGKKILQIISKDQNLLYYSILLKTLNDILDLYDEYEITEIHSKKIILNEILRKINNLTSYHNNKNESIYVHIFEYIFGYFIKSDQNNLVDNIYDQFTKNENDRKIFQLLMGAGKTSVVNPLLNLKLINTTNNFILNILPESLVNQSFNILRNILKYILNIEVIKYDVSRDTKIENNIIFENNKVYIMSDSSYKSYYLNCIENKKDFYKIFKNNAFVIVDEVDLVSDTLKSETNFPLKGSHKPNDLNNEFIFIYRIVDILESEYPTDHEINSYLLNQPNILLIDETKYYDVLNFYKEKLCELIDSYLEKDEKINPEILLLNKKMTFNTTMTQKTLEKYYFIRTIFNDILPLVIKQKHRLNFGLFNETFDKFYNFNFVAIPYLALDIPAFNKENKISSEFSNYYIKIFLTYISYTAKNSKYLRFIDVNKYVKYIKDIYIDIKIKTKNFIEDKDIKVVQLFENLKKLFSIEKMELNNFDINEFKYENLIKNIEKSEFKLLYKNIIKSYLKFILNEFIKIDTQVYNCSFIDTITPNFSRFTSGFTGTPYLYIPFIDIDKKEYNVIINSDDENKIIRGMNNDSLNLEDTQIFNIGNNMEIFSLVVDNDFSALIDAGSYFINKTSYEVIKEIKEESIKKNKNFEYFIFIDNDHIKKYITKINDKPILFNESSIPLKGRFIYFDNGHITGQDFKLNPNATGIITINLENTFRDIAQGIFRLRKLNSGQKISYCMLNKVKEFNKVENIQQLIKWLQENNKKVLEDRELIGIIQNIRREIKCNCQIYFLGQIENFKPKNQKQFYFNTYNFIIDNLIEQYNNTTHNEKLDSFVDYLIKLYLSKYNKTKPLTTIQTQEQQQEQMQNILQQNVLAPSKYIYSYLTVDYFYDIQCIKNRRIDYKLYYDDNFENSLKESNNLYNIDNLKFPYLHLFIFKKKINSHGKVSDSEINVEYYLTNYINLLQNISMYSNDTNPIIFKLYNTNGNLLFNNLELSTDNVNFYLYNNTKINNIDSYINGTIMNISILQNLNNNNFETILNYIEYFFDYDLEKTLDIFKKQEGTYYEKYLNYNNIINDYIDKNKSSKNLIFLRNLLRLNAIYIKFSDFKSKISSILNAIIKCSEEESIKILKQDIYLLLLILGIDEESIDYDNNCGLLVCRQTSTYDILKYFDKSNKIKDLFKKYNHDLCNIINKSIKGNKFKNNDIKYNFEQFTDFIIYNDVTKINLLCSNFNITIEKMTGKDFINILDITKKTNQDFNFIEKLQKTTFADIIKDISFENSDLINLHKNHLKIILDNSDYFNIKSKKIKFKDNEHLLEEIIDKIIDIMDFTHYIEKDNDKKIINIKNTQNLILYYKYFYEFIKNVEDVNELSNYIKNYIIMKWLSIFSNFRNPYDIFLSDKHTKINIYNIGKKLLIINKETGIFTNIDFLTKETFEEIFKNIPIHVFDSDVLEKFKLLYPKDFVLEKYDEILRTDKKNDSIIKTIPDELKIRYNITGGYYNKYLKYKQKYLSLKNKYL